MTTPVIALFNNKGGVGKTSLVYHLSWMFADNEWRVIAADLDPQANLTAAFLTDEALEELWNRPDRGSVLGAVAPLLRGVGDVLDEPPIQRLAESLWLLPGDLVLSKFEDELSQQWIQCLAGNERAFRVISAFWRLVQNAAATVAADVALVDLGPNLGAINRAALIAADHVVVPLAPDLFSLQGLQNLGPALRGWRGDWKDRLEKRPDSSLVLPGGAMEPTGYVVLQHAVRLDRPVKAYERWIRRIPFVFSEAVRNIKSQGDLTVSSDPDCLSLLKHYRSLMPLAQEARKPMFHLLPADRAIGAHFSAVQDVRRDFKQLADRIKERCGLTR